MAMSDMRFMKELIAQVVRAELSDEFGDEHRWENKQVEMEKVE
jgi:hypothetical protein